MEDSKEKTVEARPIVFKASSHEDIFKIATVMQRKVYLCETDTTGFAVGLKLSSGVMIKNKDHELIKQLMPNLKDFMKKLKSN